MATSLWSLFYLGKNMEPSTQWIRDNGTILEENTDVLIDELGNYFVDESGNNLLDSPSSDGLDQTTVWSSSL